MRSHIKGTVDSLARMNIGKAAIGFGVVDGASTFYMRRKDNPEESAAKSGVIAAGTAAGWMFAAPVMWAKTINDVSYGLGATIQNARKNSYEQQFMKNDMRGSLGGNFQDTDYAYTTRQRAVQAMQQSRINGRSALGGEARSLHRL